MKHLKSFLVFTLIRCNKPIYIYIYISNCNCTASTILVYCLKL
jgi:hypothetical protein